MNQRILLPAFVLGSLFSVVLTVVHVTLPSAETPVIFIVNAIVMLVALSLYGALMRRAANLAAPPAALSQPERKAASSTQTSTRQPSGRSSARGDRDGSRGSRGDEKRRGERTRDSRNGGRGGQRNNEERSGSGRARDDEAPRSEAPAGPREEGSIKWFSGAKGYGFIVRDDGSEIFVHHRALRDRTRRDIPDGQSVSFVLIERDKGPQADDVEVIAGGAKESAA